MLRRPWLLGLFFRASLDTEADTGVTHGTCSLE